MNQPHKHLNDAEICQLVEDMNDLNVECAEIPSDSESNGSEIEDGPHSPNIVYDEFDADDDMPLSTLLYSNRDYNCENDIVGSPKWDTFRFRKYQNSPSCPSTTTQYTQKMCIVQHNEKTNTNRLDLRNMQCTVVFIKE